jgi:hypothetical protein
MDSVQHNVGALCADTPFITSCQYPGEELNMKSNRFLNAGDCIDSVYLNNEQSSETIWKIEIRIYSACDGNRGM